MHFLVSIEIVPFCWYLTGENWRCNFALFCDLYYQSFFTEYCEGFIEVINTVEERIELESRLKVYEEMLSNMNVEVERLQETEDSLSGKVDELQNEMKDTEKRIAEYEADVNERKGKLTIAEKIKSSLQQQKQD